jgi:hypothetical protein
VAVSAFTGSAGAMTQVAASASPWIASDKADYAPGSTVHLTGGNWKPGEDVSILTNDTIGNTWSQTDTVTADASGAIADDVVLPNYFISDYTVTATAASGTATTTFTDAVNYQFLGKDGFAHATSGAEEDLGTVASGTSVSAACPSGLAAKGTGLGGGQSSSYAISYVSGYGDNATLSSGGRTQINPGSGTFNGNDAVCTSLAISTTGLAGGTYHGELQMRNTGGATATTDIYFFRFTVAPTQQATSISAVSGSGTYGGTATLTATLKSGTTPLGGKSISFTVNGNGVGSATTDGSGVASLGGVSIAGINAGTGTVGASFAGDSGLSASSGSGTLTVAKADSTTSVSCPASVAYDGSAKTPCSATVTGAGGLSQSLGVNYANNTNAGSASASASYAGDSNHNGSSDSKSFTIAPAASTTTVSCPAAALAYDGSAKTPCTAAVTGAGGLNQTLTVSYSDNVGAGTATASASYAGDANHASSSDSKTFTIGKASSSTSLSCPATVTYDGSPKTPCSAGVTGAGGLNQAVGVVYSNNTNAGTASATATFAGDSNHDGSGDSKTFTIAKADQSISFSAPFSATYGETFQVHPTASSGLPIALGGTAGICSVAADALQLGVFDVTMLAGTATCALSASQAGDSNYNAATSVSRNVAAAKASQAITFDALADRTYGDADFAVSASASSGLPVSFAASGSCSLNGSTVHIDSAGSCTITASQAGNGNYDPAADVMRSFGIAKAASTVTVSCSAGPFTFSGSAYTPCSAGVTGVGGLNEALLVSYSDNVNAGTATASATYAGDANHSGDSDSKTFAIAKADSHAIVDCPNSTTYTGGPIEPCTASATGAGGLDQPLSVTYSHNVDAGTASASARFDGDANHDGSNGSATFEIAKATSEVVVDCPAAQTYSGDPITPCSAKVTGAGGLDESLDVTYAGNVNAGTANASASYGGDANHEGSNGSDTFAIEQAPSSVTVTCDSGPFTYTGAPQTPCSAKATGAGGLNKDLDVAYEHNTDAGTASASASFAGDANHEGSNGSATFAIAKATSTVDVTCTGSHTYTGDPITPCSAKVTGAGGLDQNLDVSYEHNTDAGTATATASYAGDDNHLGDSGSDTFTIAKAPSSVELDCPSSQTYSGDAIAPCSAHATGAGGLDRALSVSYADNVNAGTATASASFDGDANHEGSGNSATFTIKKAPSTVSVHCTDGPFTYTGSAQTPCSADVTGAGGLHEDLPVSYSDNVNAGTATASASYAGDANHTGDSGSHTFAIGKASSQVTVACEAGPFTYTGSPHTPCSANVKGAGGLDQALTVNYSDNTDAGTATASASYDGDANHTGDSASKHFTIDKAPSHVTVTCPDSRTYTGSPIEPCTARVAGAGGLDAAIAVSYTGNVDAGTAGASASFAGDANHLGDSGTGSFTIAKAPSTVIVTCGAGPFTYTGSPQTPCSAKATGAGGLDVTLSVTYADNVNAGTATASAGYAGDANHLGGSSSKTFTIGKATPTVSVTWANWTYDGAAHPATGSVTGVGGAALGTPAFTYYAGTAASGTPLAGAPTGVGAYTVLASFADTSNYVAASKTKTVSGLYRWDGFLQPINDTAHQGGFESFFKLGSTVPAKFQLKRADGTVVQAGSAPLFSRSATPVSCDTQIAAESLVADSASTGSSFRWDGASQYIYNWSTKGLARGEYRIYATLDDGTKQYVDICLQ